MLRNLPITNTGLGCINGPNPVQIIESTQKAAKLGLILNPKQGVLHPGTPFTLSCPFSSRDRHQLIAKLGRPFFHVFDLLLFVLLLIFVHAQWIVLNLLSSCLTSRTCRLPGLPGWAFWLYNLCMPARENAVYVWQCALNSK